MHTDLEYLDDVLARFKDFLLGVGYSVDGELEFVDHEHQINDHEDEEDATQDTDMDGC